MAVGLHTFTISGVYCAYFPRPSLSRFCCHAHGDCLLPAGQRFGGDAIGPPPSMFVRIAFKGES